MLIIKVNKKGLIKMADKKTTKSTSKKTKSTTNWANVGWLVLIQWSVALIWLMSGWEKFVDDKFVGGFTKTVGLFAAKTPHAFYADFLKSTVLASPDFFANLVRTGEIFVGVALVVFGAYYLITKKLDPIYRGLLAVALVAGALLNLNFYLAAGWSSPSTAGINTVMGLVQVILAAFYIKTLANK